VQDELRRQLRAEMPGLQGQLTDVSIREALRLLATVRPDQREG